MKKKSIVLSFILAFSLFICGCNESSSSTGTDILGGNQPWVDSDLIDSIKADDEYREQDDFVAAVNHDWKVLKGDKYFGLFQEAEDSITEGKLKILTDEAIEGETAEKLRTYYELADDWNARDKDGAEPLRPYIEDIASIESIDNMYDFFADTKRNPLGLGLLSFGLDSLGQSQIHPGTYRIGIFSPELSMSRGGRNDAYFSMNTASTLELYESVENRTKNILGRLGYTQDEASDLFTKFMKAEMMIARADNQEYVEKEEDITYSREEAFKLAKDFPLEKIIDGWGYTDIKDIVINPVYARALHKMCKKNNLEELKSYLIVTCCLESALFLDRDAVTMVHEFTEPRLEETIDYGKTDEKKDIERLLDFYIGGTPMCGAMNRLYCENFFDDACVSDLESITYGMIDTFEEIFGNEEWMSDEGKAACIEKLRSIRVHVAYQDFDTVDYNDLDIVSRKDGGNFLEAYFESQRFGARHAAWLSSQPFDLSYWDPVDPGVSTTVTNAFYNPETNGIFIFAGVCVPPMYSLDMDYEKKLGGLGIIVGHEITHGFDITGAQYDKDGIKTAWMPEADQATFNDKNDKVGIYVSTFRPYPGSGFYNGGNVVGEMTADMGGIKVTLAMGGKKPGFDYDKYFRTFADVWKCNVPLEEEKQRFSGDVHPLAFYRVNIGVQQFDEFYSTYNVTDKDKMYLDPGSRIAVW